MPALRRAWEFVVWAQLWTALGSVAQTAWVAQRFLDASNVWRVALAAGLGTWAMYLLLRWRASQDSIVRKGSEALNWVFLRGALPVQVASVAVVIAAVLLWPCRSLVWPVITVALIPGSLYLRPGPGTQWVGLRAIPGLKLPVIVSSWLLVTVVLPLRMAEEVDLAVGLLAVGMVQLPFYIAIALLFDLRDSKTEDPRIRTIPHILGERWTTALVVLLLVYAGGIVLLRGFMGYDAHVEGATPWTDIGVALGFGAAASFALFPSAKRSELLHATLADGILVLIPALQLMGSLL